MVDLPSFSLKQDVDPLVIIAGPDLNNVPDTFPQECLIGSTTPVPVACTGKEN